MAGIYIHIPFCKQACHYCDFHFSTNLAFRHEMVSAIITELSLRRAYVEGEPVETIYFGGGTPSLLTDNEVGSIISTIAAMYKVSADAEVTLEANPDDLSHDKLAALKKAGINRLSIGIQSFNDHILQFLNRSHDANAARRSVEQSRAAGFKNISIDLIYAIPQQSNALWEQNLDEAISLNPDHISSYSLTIEPKTFFGNRLAHGKFTPYDDDASGTQLETLIDKLTNAGYEHYEISNFAKPGYYSKHNSSYWRQKNYLGVGPSAHSFNGVSRQANIRNNHQYLKSISEGVVPFEMEILSRKDQINDYLLTTLRTSWGCDLTYLRDHLSYDLLSENRNYIEKLLQNHYGEVADNILRLTQRGKFIADRICGDLFLVDE
jgi:oxygen-independent coproporphyrinogen III oxidase